MKNRKAKVVFLGIPLLVLFIAGIAGTAFLSVNLFVQGIREGAVGQIAVGGVIAAMWLFMLYKTTQARRRVNS